MDAVTKFSQLQGALTEKGLDATCINDPMIINYLTGFYSDPVERVLTLVLLTDSEPFLFAPAPEVEAIEDTGWKHSVYRYLDHEKLFKLVTEHTKSHAGSPIDWGAEGESLTADRLRALEEILPNAHLNTDLSLSITKIRMIRSDDEITKLNEAEKWTGFAFKVRFETIQIGKTEQEVVADLEYVLKQHGINKMGFSTPAQASPHVAEPHGATSSNKIQNNRLVLSDLGTIVDGYISDAFRTMAVGKSNDKQRDIYKVCLETQLAARDTAEPGMTAEELDRIACDIITVAGYGKYFVHRFGHGVGSSEHGSPSIMEGDQLVLEPEMCLFIEPGTYIPDFADVRIEDCVHITEDGYEPFTYTTKELLTLPH